MKSGSTRWWRENEDGTITCIVAPPGQPEPEGWNRGFPPKQGQERIEHAERMRRVHKGIEKSSIQRQRMAMAKIGVPKSNTHKKNMSLAHKRRHIRILEIMKMYHTDYGSASSYEAQLKKSSNKPEWYEHLLNETIKLTFD